MKELLKNLKVWQKTLIILGFLLAIILVVVAVIYANNVEPKVKIVFENTVNIPSDELMAIRKKMVGVIEGNTEAFDDNTIYVGKARGYQEETIDGETTATFVVDFDEIKQSYQVEVTWPNPDDGSPNIYITCPLLDSKYPETKCATEFNSSADIISYLPYSGMLSSGKEYTVIPNYEYGMLYLEIRVDACGDKTILDKTSEAVRDWLNTINFDPDDYVLYVVPNICNGEEIDFDFENDYVRANYAKTNDQNINKILPYYIPHEFYIYPAVDNNNNVTSVKVKVGACREYQIDFAKDFATRYLMANGINYPVEFDECAE